MKDKILGWFANGSVGASSKTMATCIADLEVKSVSYPWDPDDLNRCLLFLVWVPEARQHLNKVALLSDVWKRLIDNWEELEAMFLEEVGLNWCKAHSASKTYKFMSSIIEKE